jgi:hypothetical protein
MATGQTHEYTLIFHVLSTDAITIEPTTLTAHMFTGSVPIQNHPLGEWTTDPASHPNRRKIPATLHDQQEHRERRTRTVHPTIIITIL